MAALALPAWTPSAKAMTGSARHDLTQRAFILCLLHEHVTVAVMTAETRAYDWRGQTIETAAVLRERLVLDQLVLTILIVSQSS